MEETRYKLEDDPFCGLTTGGQENCEWGCSTVPLRPENDIMYTTRAYFVDPACLIDCFPDGHCGKDVIQEYIEAGVACSGSSWYDHDNNDNNDVECQYTSKYNAFLSRNLTLTTVGIFSPETLSKLNSAWCLPEIFRRSLTLVTTFQYLVYTSSDIETYEFWEHFHEVHVLGLPSFVSDVTNRLHPGTR